MNSKKQTSYLVGFEQGFLLLGTHINTGVTSDALTLESVLKSLGELISSVPELNLLFFFIYLSTTLTNYTHSEAFGLT